LNSNPLPHPRRDAALHRFPFRFCFHFHFHFYFYFHQRARNGACRFPVPPSFA